MRRDGCGGTGRFPRSEGFHRKGWEKQRGRRKPDERRGGLAEALLGERPVARRGGGCPIEAQHQKLYCKEVASGG